MTFEQISRKHKNEDVIHACLVLLIFQSPARRRSWNPDIKRATVKPKIKDLKQADFI